MKNFIGFSLTLVMAPILFVGCVGEKTASIKPLTLKQKNIVLDKKEIIILDKKKIVVLDKSPSISKEEALLSSAIFGGGNSFNRRGLRFRHRYIQ